MIIVGGRHEAQVHRIHEIPPLAGIRDPSNLIATKPKTPSLPSVCLHFHSFRVMQVGYEE